MLLLVGFGPEPKLKAGALLGAEVAALPGCAAPNENVAVNAVAGERPVPVAPLLPPPKEKDGVVAGVDAGWLAPKAKLGAALGAAEAAVIAAVVAGGAATPAAGWLAPNAKLGAALGAAEAAGVAALPWLKEKAGAEDAVVAGGCVDPNAKLGDADAALVGGVNDGAAALAGVDPKSGIAADCATEAGGVTAGAGVGCAEVLTGAAWAVPTGG